MNGHLAGAEIVDMKILKILGLFMIEGCILIDARRETFKPTVPSSELFLIFTDVVTTMKYSIIQ